MNKRLLVYLLFIIAIALRLYHLGFESFWYDELFTVHLCLQDFPQFWESIISDVHPPLYNIIIYFIYNYVGTSEFILRIPSVLFSMINLYFL